MDQKPPERGAGPTKRACETLLVKKRRGNGRTGERAGRSYRKYSFWQRLEARTVAVLFCFVCLFCLPIVLIAPPLAAGARTIDVGPLFFYDERDKSAYPIRDDHSQNQPSAYMLHERKQTMLCLQATNPRPGLSHALRRRLDEHDILKINLRPTCCLNANKPCYVYRRPIPDPA
jgi:hypothetical protein